MRAFSLPHQPQLPKLPHWRILQAQGVATESPARHAGAWRDCNVRAREPSANFVDSPSPTSPAGLASKVSPLEYNQIFVLPQRASTDDSSHSSLFCLFSALRRLILLVTKVHLAAATATVDIAPSSDGMSLLGVLSAKVLAPFPYKHQITYTCLLSSAWIGACSCVVYSTRGQLIGGAHVHVADLRCR